MNRFGIPSSKAPAPVGALFFVSIPSSLLMLGL
jgi:hypothetical protein